MKNEIIDKYNKILKYVTISKYGDINIKIDYINILENEICLDIKYINQNKFKYNHKINLLCNDNNFNLITVNSIYDQYYIYMLESELRKFYYEIKKYYFLNNQIRVKKLVN